jgi:tetratricopeptide (TPR) repeat protein
VRLLELPVTCHSSINPLDFISRVEPLLQKRDLPGLLHLLKTRWTYDQLKDLMRSPHHDARKVAMLSLSLVGGRCAIPVLVEHLKDAEPCANQMAEHALWCIWFRCGSDQANALIKQGADALEAKNLERAEELFSHAIEADPSFAEAYNQRAIVRYLEERYAESLADCECVVERMPCHFGAWAGMGHCHAHLGDTAKSIECYTKALEINPLLEKVDETLMTLKCRCKPE